MPAERPAALEVTGMALALPVGAHETAGAPLVTVRRFRMRLSGYAVQRLLDPSGTRLRIRLVAGGAALEVFVGPLRVLADLAGSVTAQGGLKVEARSLRVGGWLPVPPQWAGAIRGLVEGKPGLRMLGPQALELDLAALLEYLFREQGWRVAARIRHVAIDRDGLEVECDSEVE